MAPVHRASTPIPISTCSSADGYLPRSIHSLCRHCEVTSLALGLAFILGATALALLIPVTVLFAEILLALAYDERSATPETGERRRLAVLVPAHDEALIIASTLRSVVPQLIPNDTLLVVADNCSDETEAVATKEGAKV